MQKDIVSVVIPVHNAEKYINDTVNSVLNQTYDAWELILVENASDDSTVRILEEIKKRDPRIRIMDLKDAVGAAAARNMGVSAATGRYIAFLDADDIWHPEKLEKEVAFINEKEAAFVFTGYEFANEKAKPSGKIVKVPESLSHIQAMKNTTIFTSTVMFDTTRIDREKIRMPQIKSEDTALWWNILREGYLAYGLNENLVLYRRPGKSLSSNKIEAIKRIWYLYRKWEKLNVFTSSWYFMNWAFRAVLRRI
ncbi:MAG: glycosyltransferase family 2 protein [Lachnospiraceae bacterium]|nr:glycosyltransferase family 2 protein [Lachnospiraceae bacterium]